MGIFDIMGPVMIGPSSSHTAGPVKIANIARLIFNNKILTADIYFHGSFAETYSGHGTDRAVVGGLLGYSPDDKRIKKSLKIAKDKNIEINFHKIKLRNTHPNTILIKLKNNSKKLSIQGSSVGGGNIIIHKINNYKVNISAKFPTLWILHKDKPGIVGKVTSNLGEYNINIAYMQLCRKHRGKTASSIIELDHQVSDSILRDLENKEGIQKIRFIPAL